MKKPSTIFAVAQCAFLVLSLTACETKRAAHLQAQQAYVTGQEQVLDQTRAKDPVVTVNGLVNNPVIAWTAGLTLAKAIVAADYHGYMRPKVIRVTRKGQSTEIKASDLLNGQDMPLEAGDVVDILP